MTFYGFSHKQQSRVSINSKVGAKCFWLIFFPAANARFFFSAVNSKKNGEESSHERHKKRRQKSMKYHNTESV